MLKGLILVFASAAVAGCGGDAGSNAETPNEATRADGGNELTHEEWLRQFEKDEKAIVLPVDPRHRKLELTPQWLASYWVAGKAACYGSDSGMHFRADGTYSDYEESGTYTLTGSKLTMITAEVSEGGKGRVGDQSGFDIEIIGPNEIEGSWPDGTRHRFYRCPAEPLKG